MSSESSSDQMFEEITVKIDSEPITKGKAK